MNLQEEEEHYQFFVEGKFAWSDSLTLHGELLLAKNEIDALHTSPSFPMLNGLGFDRVVRPGMPHFDDFVARNPALAPIMSAGALTFGRTFGVSGPAQKQTREIDSYRANLAADWSPSDRILDLHYNVAFNNEQTRVFASIYNLTDEDPPRARLDGSYDPFTHDPFGVVFKLGVQHRFLFGRFN